MACEPKLSWQIIDKGNVKFQGKCEGQCDHRDGCVPSWSWDPTKSPNVKVAASVTSGVSSEVLVEATDNPVQDYVIKFGCSCGDQSKTVEAKYSLTFVRPLWQDIVSFGVTVAIDKLLKSK